MKQFTVGVFGRRRGTRRDGKAATSSISAFRQGATARQNVSRETPVSFERYKQQPRAQTRHLAQNARLFEDVSRETSKTFPESFIRSGEFYKKRSVAAIFAQPGLSCGLSCADSCCCGAERVLLKSSGNAAGFHVKRLRGTATLPRRSRQKQSAAVFAPERLAFPIARGAGVL